MAKCILFKTGGSSADLDSLTATPQYVRNGKKFYGKGTDALQTGTAEEHKNQVTELELNGVYAIPKGIHENTQVKQSGLLVLPGQTLEAKSNPQVIYTDGAYMEGDIIVPAVKNLTPENVRNGVTVGDVTGTFTGF